MRNLTSKVSPTYKLEIKNTNIVQGEQAGAVTIDKLTPAQAMSDPRIKHLEFRDDRSVAAVRLDSNVLTLFYRVRVMTPGKFVVPPLYADDMYRPDVYGQVGGVRCLLSLRPRRGMVRRQVVSSRRF